MGLFDRLAGSTPKPQNVFISGNGAEPLPPAHYGFHSFNWGIDNASTLTEEICSMQNAAIATEPSLIERIQHDGSRLRIQLIALYGAIYFAYPHLILRVPHQVMLEVRKGLFDGIDGLQDEKGQFPQDRKQGIKGLIGKYFDAMVEDFNTEKDPRAFNPRGDKTFQTFDKYITYAYRDDGESFDHFSSIELMLLQPLIDAQPTNIMLTLRDEAKLIFVA